MKMISCRRCTHFFL